jgi:hypothetical protein
MEKEKQVACHRNRRLGHYAVAGILLAALAGCGPMMIQSNPGTFAVAPEAGAQLRGPQSVALNNAYKAETQVKIFEGRSRDWMADLQQYTKTAIAILDREMTKKGISNTPQAAKSVALRVRDVHSGLGWHIRASLVLEAQYGDGTKSTIVTENTSPATAQRAVDGAIMLAVTQLLRDEQFLAYVNR